MTLAISGASGKTGWRIADEALQRGQAVRAILRPGSLLPPGLEGRDQLEVVRTELGNSRALSEALRGCSALVIATGARPSVDLAGPLKVDALAIRDQIQACRAAGVTRGTLLHNRPQPGGQGSAGPLYGAILARSGRIGNCSGCEPAV